MDSLASVNMRTRSLRNPETCGGESLGPDDGLEVVCIVARGVTISQNVIGHP